MRTLFERLVLFIRGLRVGLRNGLRVLLLIGVFVGGLWLGGGRGGSETGFFAKVRETVEGRLGSWVSELKLLAGSGDGEGERFAVDLRGVGSVRGARLSVRGPALLDTAGGEKGRSREFTWGQETEWPGVRPGDRVRIATPFGGEVEGLVNLAMVDAGGWVRLGGDVEGGQFSLGRKGDEVYGSVLLPEVGVGFELTPESESTGRVTERPLAVMICERTYQAAVAAPDEGGAGVGSVPVLDSAPSAARVVYLDFDGETVTDPAWNGGRKIVAAPARLTTAQMREVFNRVVEDYAPFAVSITTDVRRYNSAAVGSRMRCIVTPTSTASPGAGGVAMMNSFAGAGRAFSATVPCWVFNTSVTAIAESVSHEVGHTLGLLHSGRVNPAAEYFSGHGSGALSWGPIMGVSYSRGVTQWSKGEYRGANNRQDQIAIIKSVLGGVSDESGETEASSVALPVGAGGAVSFEGVIGADLDVDAYAIQSSGGAFSLQVAPVSVGANLDVSVELRDSGGKVVASGNPEASLTASVAGRLVAGRYLLVIQGAAKGNSELDGYSRYGSVGRYLVTGTIEGVGQVSGQRPTVTGPSEVKGVVGRPLEVVVQGGGGVLGWSISGVLPTGMVFDQESGSIRGAPTVVGSYRVTVTARNEFGSASVVMTLLITGGELNFGEVLDYAGLSFSSSGDASWFSDSSKFTTGTASVRSGVIGDGGKSVLRAVVDGPTWVSFDWSVSSERNADILAVSVGGRVQRWISGQSGWENVKVYVSRAQTEVTWTYVKDGDTVGGADAGWVDGIKVGSPPVIRGVSGSGVYELGKPFKLRADADGGTSFIWMRNGRQLAGVDGVEYSVESSRIEDAGVYTVLCKNDFGLAISRPIAVEVVGPLRFLGELKSVTARAGGRALFAVQMSQASGLEFTWMFNGTRITSGVAGLKRAGLPPEWNGAVMGWASGRGAAFLELSGVPASASGQISVEVRSSSGSVLVGGPASLRVEAPIPKRK